jgi:hypothetical protein
MTLMLFGSELLSGDNCLLPRIAHQQFHQPLANDLASGWITLRLRCFVPLYLRGSNKLNAEISSLAQVRAFKIHQLANIGVPQPLEQIVRAVAEGELHLFAINGNQAVKMNDGLIIDGQGRALVIA